MEREIIQAILTLINQEHTITLKTDWGGNSLTLYVDDSHTHCGDPECSFDGLIQDLYNTLVKNKGLSFTRASIGFK